MYINKDTLETKSWSEIRKENKNVSIPANGIESIMDQWFLIHKTDKIPFDKYIEKLVLSNPTKLSGIWSEKWAIENLSAEEISGIKLKELNKKIEEIDKKFDSLSTIAYSNPQISVEKDPKNHKKDISIRTNNKLNKIVGEILLTQEEKDEAKLDQKLSEYEVKLSINKNKVLTNLYKLTGAGEINNFDVELENWESWTPPT